MGGKAFKMQSFLPMAFLLSVSFVETGIFYYDDFIFILLNQSDVRLR